MRLKNKIQILK